MRIAAGLLLASLLGWAQVARDANAPYRTKEGRAGIAAGLDSPERDARQKPRELIEELAIRPGSTTVDMGTGAGYMLPYLSNAVGPAGRVIAEDIQTDFLDRAREKARREGLKNVEFTLGTDVDPHLPAGAADLILVLDVYHHFDYPEKMLAGIRAALKPDGRLAVVEFYKRRGSMGPGDPDRPLQHIRLDADGVIREVEANGFRLESRREHVPGSQYLAIFRKQ